MIDLLCNTKNPAGVTEEDGCEYESLITNQYQDGIKKCLPCQIMGHRLRRINLFCMVEQGLCAWNDNFTGEDGDPLDASRWDYDSGYDYLIEIKNNMLYLIGDYYYNNIITNKGCLSAGDFEVGIFYVGATFIDNLGPRYKLLKSFRYKDKNLRKFKVVELGIAGEECMRGSFAYTPYTFRIAIGRQVVRKQGEYYLRLTFYIKAFEKDIIQFSFYFTYEELKLEEVLTKGRRTICFYFTYEELKPISILLVSSL